MLHVAGCWPGGVKGAGDRPVWPRSSPRTEAVDAGDRISDHGQADVVGAATDVHREVGGAGDDVGGAWPDCDGAHGAHQRMLLGESCSGRRRRCVGNTA